MKRYTLNLLWTAWIPRTPATGRLSPSAGRWCLCVLRAALYVLRPVAHVLVGVEHEVGRTGHVVLTLALAHVVHRAVRLVRVVGDVTVLLLASHRRGCGNTPHTEYSLAF